MQEVHQTFMNIHGGDVHLQPPACVTGHIFQKEIHLNTILLSRETTLYFKPIKTLHVMKRHDNSNSKYLNLE